MSTLDSTVAADLVRRITAGEEEAENELIERSGPTLRFLTLRYSRDEADAEDLYQETLILALEKIRNGAVEQPERLAGFLRALAKNLSTQQYRRRRYAVEKPTAELPDAPDEQQSDGLHTLLHDERLSLTRQLLAQLEIPRDREVLFRYYIREEASVSICADLNIEGDHFYRVLHRARQRYRQLWDNHSRFGKATSKG